LRALKKKEPNEEIITISAVDPLNLVGIILPGVRIPAISGKTVVLQDGISRVK
jgi:ATP-dependent Lhr-like helicase